MAKTGARRYTCGRTLPTTINLLAASLLGLLAFMATNQQYLAAAQDLVFTVTTIQDVSSAGFSTWISLLATSLLPSDTPGAFLGTIPPDTVETVCQAVEAGQTSFEAQVTVQGNTQTYNIQVQNIGGCDASESSPQGVELVYVDDSRYTSAVICDDNTFSIGCTLYVTGDDVTEYYNGAMSNGSAQVKEGGRRKLLDEGCFLAGGATGVVVATIEASEACAAAGPFYFPCVVSASILGFSAGAVVGCSVMAMASCFPGTSLVMLKSKEYKYMSELVIGDEVATWGENGGIKFDSIYAMGHVDGNSSGLYFDITLMPAYMHGHNGTVDIKSQRNLQISPGHFVPTLSGEGNIIYKRALEINVGDQMWAMVSFKENATSVFTVKEISMSVHKGLFNPFTLGGSIIVNGVVASTHSEWFLDDIFTYMGISDHWLPLAYQVILSPFRLIYRTLPNVQYRRLYAYIDKHLDIPTFGTQYGGLIASIEFGISFLLGAILIVQLFMRRGVKKGTIYIF